MSNRYAAEIKRSNLFPQKKFGQNFLIDESALDKIVKYSSIKESDEILEVGPGLGFLTEKLIASSPKSIHAIEIDKRLDEYLAKKFGNKIQVTCADAMKVEEKELVDHKFKVVSNLPYNVSVPLIMKWMENGEIFSEFYLLVQKEVALRIVADSNDTNYGAISVLIDYLCERQVLFEVLPSSFMPEPKVDSAVVRLKIRKEYRQLKTKYFSLKNIVTQLFANRRKMIRKALSKMTEDWQALLQNIDVKDTARAEEIPCKKLIAMAELIDSSK